MRLRIAAENKIAGEYINSDEFFVDTEKFDFEKAEFRADYFWDDRWGSETFRLTKEYKDEEVKKNGFDHFYVSSIDQPEIREDCKDQICFTVQVPHLYNGSLRKKDPSKARRLLRVQYHFLFVRTSEKFYKIQLTIPENKVSEELKNKINECCKAAAQEYIRKNIEPKPGHFTSFSGEPYYPYNFLLDNGYCGVEMVYDDKKRFDWDMFC